MKSPSLLLVFLLLPLVTRATSITDCPEYARLIHEGDSLKAADYYIEAFNKYNSALTYVQSEGACVEFLESAQERINELFKTIEDLRQEAIHLREMADSTAIEARKSEARARRLADAIYFYNGLYGLVQHKAPGGKVESYYVDTFGREVTKLGQWWAAGPFINGYARVQEAVLKDDSFVDYLIDVDGNRFKLAYGADGLSKNIVALDLYRKRLKQLPSDVAKNTQLKILIVNSNRNLNTSPIEKLQNLIYLDVSSCDIDKLPSGVFQLKNLKVLYMTDNPFKHLPSIKGLKSLEELYLTSDTKLKELPDDIGELQNLRLLDLYRSNVRTLPESINRLAKLECIIMMKNAIPIAELNKLGSGFVITQDKETSDMVHITLTR